MERIDLLNFRNKRMYLEYEGLADHIEIVEEVRKAPGLHWKVRKMRVPRINLCVALNKMGIDAEVKP